MYKFANRVGREHDGHGARLDFGKVQDLGQKRIEMVCRLANERGSFAERGFFEPQLHQFRKTANAGQRCAQLMRYGGHEFAFGLAGGLGLCFAHRQCGVRFFKSANAAQEAHATGHDGNPQQQGHHQSDVAHAAPFLQRALCGVGNQHVERVSGHAPKRGDSFHVVHFAHAGVGAFGFVDVQERVVTGQLEHLAHAGGLTSRDTCAQGVVITQQRYSSAGAQVHIAEHRFEVIGVDGGHHDPV